MAIVPTLMLRRMMSIQSWKEGFQGAESIKRITDRESGIKSPKSFGCQFCEKHLVSVETKCPVCGKAIKNYGISKIWRTCQQACSILAYPFLQVHYGLSHFFHWAAKKIARPGFESRVEFILGFTFGLGIVTFLIILGGVALYRNQASYFLFPQEPAQPVFSDTELPVLP
jgi:hypothetical protein